MAPPHMRRSEKTGLPPGSLVHIGEKFGDTTTITILDYGKSRLEEKESSTIPSACGPVDDQTIRWIDVDAVHDIRILEQLGPLCGLHPLTLEDILNTDQRPKMEDFGEYIYIVLKMFSPSTVQAGEAAPEQISIVLGKNFVISLRERKSDVFHSLRERIRHDRERIAGMGADYLAYAILDTVVDNYFAVLENKEERMDLLEEELMESQVPPTMHAIQNLKREMIYLRKAVWPLRETINNLTRSESPLIRNATRLYLRDVYDHTIQVIDTIETFRDMLSGMLDIYLTGINNRMNEIMKVLTIIATIFIPLTFIAGIYGMNFKYMPELEWHWGYYGVLTVMAVIVVFMVMYFKRKKWL